MFFFIFGMVAKLLQPESTSFWRAFRFSIESGRPVNLLQSFNINKTSFWRFPIVEGRPFIEVPSKYNSSRFSGTRLNSSRLEQLLRMSVFREINFICGRDLRLVHPLRFKNMRLSMFCSSSWTVFNSVQLSRFILSSFRACDKPDNVRSLLEWFRSSHFNFDAFCGRYKHPKKKKKSLTQHHNWIQKRYTVRNLYTDNY